MRMPILKIMIMTGLLILAVSACSNNQPNISKDLQESFQEMIPIADTNTNLSIKIISDGQNENKSGFDIKILVENISKQNILFPVNSKVIRVFIIRNNTWMEIKDTVKYYSSIVGGDSFILPPRGEQQPNTFTTVVRPVLEPNAKDEGKQETMRILIVGELMDDNKKTSIPVAAYVDLFMNP